MAFSKNADTVFRYEINGFNGATVDSLQEKTYSSPKFTTSVEPRREFHLNFSIQKFSDGSSSQNCRYCSRPSKKMINIKLICSKNIPNREDLKVQVSIKNDIEKVTRSFLICGTENEFNFQNIMDGETMLKIVQEGRLEVIVEIFLKIDQQESFETSNLEFLTDCKIYIQEEIFEAHKAILAKRCPYFYKIFKDDNKIEELRIPKNIKPNTFKKILKYIYEEEPFNCSDPAAEDIFLAANYLEIEQLKDECENYFRKTISVANVCSVLLLSIKASAKFLQKHCQYFIIRNIQKINFEGLKAEPEVVVHILKDIFEQLDIGLLTIVDNIDLSLKMTARKETQNYEPFLNNKQLSDIEIHVGEETIYNCHKVVLAVNSPVFYHMLISKMEEELTNVIKIKDIKPEVFYEILRYIYTGSINNLEQFGVEILEAVDRYNLETLQKLVEEFLAKNLTNENVVDLSINADFFNAFFLLKHCAKYIVKQIITYPKLRKVKNVITLKMFDCFSQNIFYEFLEVLKTECKINLQNMSEPDVECLSPKIQNDNDYRKIYSNLKYLSDFKITNRGKTFSVHKVILAKEWPYFHELFQKEREIKKLNNHDLDIDPEAFNIILHYMYSNEYPNRGRYDVILAAADILQMENLKNHCERKLEKDLSQKTVCQLLTLAVESSAKLLFNACMTFILKNIHSIDFQSLKSKPLVVLSMLEEFFKGEWMTDSFQITESINLSFEKKIETNSNYFQRIDSFLNNEKYSDVTFYVGEKTFRGHKMILSAKSPVFDRMLSSEMKEAPTNVVVIEDMEPEVFYEILRYLYTGEANVEQYAFEILKAADFYNIEDLKTFTENYLAKNLTDVNVVNVVKIAQTYNASSLFKDCTNYVVKLMISNLKIKKKNSISLKLFADFQNNIFYEFLKVLTNSCKIEYLSEFCYPIPRSVRGIQVEHVHFKPITKRRCLRGRRCN
ncbi:uncharacterized protein LOC122502276 [Leptopilina heterotoma]|uniref:uncharacterized protein LOC122502276 n=1 Tax=Leptopilina heterotoma TaxID=63436 RepID=UPI001CA84658|nr:uncharacterized protein LOC122502276 [Leptopilina heterotoma]